MAGELMLFPARACLRAARFSVRIGLRAAEQTAGLATRVLRSTTPDGSPPMPDGSQEVPDGSQETPGGSQETPGGSQETPGGSQETPDGSQETPDGSQQTPGGSQQTPESAVPKDPAPAATAAPAAVRTTTPPSAAPAADHTTTPTPASPPPPPPEPAPAPVADPTPAADAIDLPPEESTVVVAELAEPGAEDGAGAEVTVAEPWEGYAGMSAQDVVARLADGDPAELAAVQLYEGTHKQRETVTSAAARELRAKRGRGPIEPGQPRTEHPDA